MLQAYINYLDDKEIEVFLTSKLQFKPLNGNCKIITTNYLKKKWHFLLYPLVFVYTLVALTLTYIKGSKHRNYIKKNYLYDLIFSTKYLTNHLSLNIFHLTAMLKFKPDLVICVCAGSTLAARIYKRITSKPFFYSMYEIFPDQIEKEFFYRRFLKIRIEYKACKNANAIIIPFCRQFERLLRMRYKLNRESIFLSLISFSKEIALPVLQNTSYPIRFYYHGSFDKQRGLDILINAISKFSNQRAQLFLRGFGELEIALKNKVKSENLNDRVIFLPPLRPDELQQAATQFDVGVTVIESKVPNNRFLIGFKSIDYIAAGIAQIVPNNFVLPILINDNNIGKVYHSLTESALVNCIEYFVLNPDKIDEMKENAHKLTTSKVNFKYQKQLLKNLICQIIDNNG